MIFAFVEGLREVLKKCRCFLRSTRLIRAVISIMRWLLVA